MIIAFSNDKAQSRPFFIIPQIKKCTLRPVFIQKPKLQCIYFTSMEMISEVIVSPSGVTACA